MLKTEKNLKRNQRRDDRLPGKKDDQVDSREKWQSTQPFNSRVTMIQSQGKWRCFPEKFQHTCEETTLSEENSRSDETTRSECHVASRSLFQGSSEHVWGAGSSEHVWGAGSCGALVPMVEPCSEGLQLLDVASSAAGLPAAPGPPVAGLRSDSVAGGLIGLAGSPGSSWLPGWGHQGSACGEWGGS